MPGANARRRKTGWLVSSKKRKKLIPGANSRKNKSTWLLCGKRRKKLLTGANSKTKNVCLVSSKRRKKPRGAHARKKKSYVIPLQIPQSWLIANDQVLRQMILIFNIILPSY